MNQSDYVFTFSSGTIIPCSHYEILSDSQGNLYEYGFNFFPSGLELRIRTHGSFSPQSIFYSVSQNCVYITEARGTSIDIVQCYFHSYGMKIYTIHGVANVTALYFTITQGYGEVADKQGYDGTDTIIEPGSATTYEDHIARKIQGKSGDIFYELDYIRRIIFIESGLGIGDDLKYNDTLDLQHYPIVKKNNSYYLTSESTFTIGNTYTFLAPIGDCYKGTDPFTSASALTNSFPTDRAVGDAFLNTYNRNIADRDPSTASVTPPHIREPLQVNTYIRQFTGRLGIQGHEMTYIPYTNEGNMTYIYKDANAMFQYPKQDKHYDEEPTLRTEAVTRDNPGVLFDNLLNSSTLDIDEDVRGVDKGRLMVNNQIYLIPPNGRVEFHTRSLSAINTPTPGTVPNVEHYNGDSSSTTYYITGSERVNISERRTYNIQNGRYYTEINFKDSRKNNATGEFDRGPLVGTNNGVFNTHSGLLNRNNSRSELSGVFKPTDSNVLQEDVSINASLTTSDPYNSDRNDCISYSICKINKMQPYTSYPIINSTNKIDILSVNTGTLSYQQAKKGDRSYLTYSISNTFIDLDMESFSNTQSTSASAYVKARLKYKIRGSGLQPLENIYYSLLTGIPDDYKNKTHSGYNQQSVTCEVSKVYSLLSPYNEAFGISFGVVYQRNYSYAYEGQYLIAFPDQ